MENWFRKKNLILSPSAEKVLCSIDALAGDLPEGSYLKAVRDRSWDRHFVSITFDKSDKLHSSRCGGKKKKLDNSNTPVYFLFP